MNVLTYLCALRTRRTGASPAPPPPPPGDLTVSLVASRTSGPAPLAVLFDATGTTSNVGGITDTFRQPVYTFNFDDPDAGTWSINATGSETSKNLHIGGPLTAHVFETPGTYDVVVTASTGDTATVQITVQDPNTVYSGTNTIVVSPTSNFSGAPAGAATATSIPAAASNRRILLRRGQSHGGISIGHDIHDCIYGAFGDGADPIVSSISVGAGNPPNANFTSRIAFVDLNVQGSITQTFCGNNLYFVRGQSTGGITLGSAFEYWAENTSGRFGPNGAVYPYNMFFYEHYARASGAIITLQGTYTRSALLGCDMAESQQHTVRMFNAWKNAVQHCQLRGIGGGAQHALKLHSGGLGTYNPDTDYADTGSTWAARYISVCDSIMGDPADNNQQTVSIRSQNSTSNSVEGIEDVLLENISFDRGSNTVGDLVLNARRGTYINLTRVGGGSVSVSTGVSYGSLPAEWQGPYYPNRS